MPRKSAKQIVDEVVAKVAQETPKPKAAKTVEAKVEHLRSCMVVVAAGECNCPESLKK